MFRASLQSRALLLLVAVFAGALLLATEAHAEGYHIPGITGGRSSAPDGRGAVPGVCDPVRPPVVAAAPAPVPAPAVQPAPAQRVAATEDGPRGKNELPSNRGDDLVDDKEKTTSKSKGDAPSEKSKGGESGEKPAEQKARLASLEPKEKLAELFKANGCVGCHTPDRFDEDGKATASAEKEIAKLILGETELPEDMPKKNLDDLKKALGKEDEALLKDWAAKKD